MRPLRLPLILAALAALCGCPTDPPPGDAILHLAVDGSARVWVDGETVLEAEGFAAVTEGTVTLPEGEHTVTVDLTGASSDAGPAAALWIELPDGTFVVSDDGWGGAADRGGYGSDPWRWSPREMMGTGARWIAPSGGGEGTLESTVTVGPAVVDRWAVRPGEAAAGDAVPVTFTLTAGSAGIEAGESRRLANTLLDASWSRVMPYPRWSGWQIQDPSAEGNLAVAAVPDGVEVALSLVEVESELGPDGQYTDGGRLELRIEVVEGTVEAGQSVEVSWGGGDGPAAPVLARRHAFAHPACEAPASSEYPGPSVGRCPAIEVRGAAATTLLVAPHGAPVAAGEALTVHVVALDEAGNRTGEHPATLTVTTTDPAAEVPASVELGEALDGVAEIPLTFATPGLHRVEVSGGDLAGAATARVTQGVPEVRLYFGDLHAHTLASDGIWHPEASYRHADEVAALDFAAITDHAERVTDDEWAAAQQRAWELTRPDFLVLAAYEWTAAASMHRNAYGLASGDPFPIVRTGAFGNNDEPVTKAEDLLEALHGQALTVPHHPGSAVTAAHDWVGYDAAFEPVVEIYSKHGSSECYQCTPAIVEDWQHPVGNYVRDALAAGHRFGFIGSGDGHETPLGSLAPDHEDQFGPGEYGPMPRRGGLAAVWSEELTLDGLMEGLRSRRCYATTGARVVLEFSSGGKPMGSEIVGDGPVQLDIAVGGTGTLAEVLVVRYTEATGWTHPASWDPGDATFVESWVDDEIAEDAIYYLHVLQADGHHAWSSPIWVDR